MADLEFVTYGELVTELQKRVTAMVLITIAPAKEDDQGHYRIQYTGGMVHALGCCEYAKAYLCDRLLPTPEELDGQ